MTTAPAKSNHDAAWDWSPTQDFGAQLPTVKKLSDAACLLAECSPPEGKQGVAMLLLVSVKAAAAATMRETIAGGFCHDLWQRCNGATAPVYLSAISPKAGADIVRMAELAGCWPEAVNLGTFEAVVWIKLEEWRALAAQRELRGNTTWPFPQPEAQSNG